MAASKCPKCGHHFTVRDGFGELLPLAHCPTCTSDYPASQGVCKWCGTPPERAPIGANLWKGVGILAFVSLAVGAWLIRDDAPTSGSVSPRFVIDTTSTAVQADSSATPQVLAGADTVGAADLDASTSVVAADTFENVPVASDSVAAASLQQESAGALAEQAPPAGGSGTADSVAPAADPAPAAPDPVRSREPWLPPPSVIVRPAAPTSAPPTAAPPTTTGSTRVASADEPAEPAEPRRPTPVAPRRATSSTPAPSPARTTAKASVKPAPKAANRAPSRTTSRVASTRVAPRKVAPPSRTASTAKAKTPPRAGARWVNSVARNWATVRSGATRQSRIVASLGPGTRVQLGESRGGWRRVKAKGLTGWVEDRLFVARATPTPRRGGRLAAQ